MSIDVIIVVYNVSLSELACVRTGWQGGACGRVIVCDNSDRDNENEAIASRLSHITYVNMGGNKGISHAYNVALEHSSADFVCLLDDDTPLPDDYLSRVSEHVAKSDADVFVPVVRANGLIYSPSRRGRFTFVPIRSLDEIDGPGSFGFINSGLTMRRSSLPVTPFDESLFLDYVDHAFMRDAVSLGLSIEIMPEVEVTQRFSFQEHDMRAERRRFSLFCRDTRAYYQRDKNGWFVGTTAIVGRLIRLVGKYGIGFLASGKDA